MAKKRLWEIVEDLDTDVLTLIKLAKREDIPYSVTDGNANLLRSKLSGYNDLTNSEIRDIDHFLKKSEAGRHILTDALSIIDLIGDEKSEREFLKYVSERLFDAMDNEELKQKIKPETVYETIRNLGVVEIYRTSASPRELKPIPVHLLKFDKDLSYKIVRNYFVKVLERCTIDSEEDFDRAREVLASEYRRLREYVAV